MNAPIWSARGTGEDLDLDIGIEVTALDTVALALDVWDDEGNRAELTIDRGESLQLFHALGDWLMATHPDRQDQTGEAQA